MVIEIAKIIGINKSRQNRDREEKNRKEDRKKQEDGESENQIVQLRKKNEYGALLCLPMKLCYARTHQWRRQQLSG